MVDKLKTVSPHNGAAVTCSHRQWEKHIVAEHPEMDGGEAAVERVINEPLAIYQSDTHPRRHVFYRPSELSPPFNRGFIRVVVEYRTRRWSGLRGHVVTAFLVAGPKKGEILIWPV
jgi:hypothetical protein